MGLVIVTYRKGIIGKTNLGLTGSKGLHPRLIRAHE